MCEGLSPEAQPELCQTSVFIWLPGSYKPLGEIQRCCKFQMRIFRVSCGFFMEVSGKNLDNWKSLGTDAFIASAFIFRLKCDKSVRSRQKKLVSETWNCIWLGFHGSWRCERCYRWMKRPDLRSWIVTRKRFLSALFEPFYIYREEAETINLYASAY